MTEEEKRVLASKNDPDGWRHWGPYLSERQWGTVREDYSPDGSAWDYFSHDASRSRAYRWGEDGIAGISDIRQFQCFALAFWNGQDAILKERMFGLTGSEGNHGEDVKEYWFFQDATPSHSYLKCLYKYPQKAFPYSDLVETNRARGRRDAEYELLDTGVFDENRYFDIEVEYAKATMEDICIRVTISNRGPDEAPLHILPTVWFRNTWSWDADTPRPTLKRENAAVIGSYHRLLGERYLLCGGDIVPSDLLFTENDTNTERLFGQPNTTLYVKDGFHERVVGGVEAAVNPSFTGTKAAAWYQATVPAGGSVTLKMRFAPVPFDHADESLGAGFDATFTTRIQEANAFYKRLASPDVSDDARLVQRQAFAGLIWSKQYYGYDVERWLAGDPTMPKPPPSRKNSRNSHWQHVVADDILSMPDPWEYPWFAAWDLAFHMIPFAQIDPDFAKHQLLLLCREWYMHPSGQLPAYEWSFDDVNPPVHAWAALRVYQIEKRMHADPAEPGDTDFLERVFHKLMLNFTWWVNRKDAQGNNIFEGGFLGLDNIGVFDRSAPLPTGGFIEQSDGTAWMAMYALSLLAIALELSIKDPTYNDVAVKFAEHFIYIAHAITDIGEGGDSLWDDEDGFFYDVLHLPDDTQEKMRVRSIVGLIPLLAVEAFDADVLARVPDFRKRLQWFLKHKPHIAANVAHIIGETKDERILFSLVGPDKLRRVLTRMLDETEFLGPHGIRALSRFHKDHPYVRTFAGKMYEVDYEPAESSSGLFGGNSNWRGPVWFPINYLLIEALQRYDYVLGPGFTVEFPTGSGMQHTLAEVATELSRRLTRTFLRDGDGRRPVYGGLEPFQTDPHWGDNILFYEYFHGDNGAGIGASHQTGWTALVAKLISQSGA